MSRRLLGLAGLIALIGVQAAIGPHLAILGVAPDLPLVAVLVVAMLSGPTRGAVTGVCVGLVLDVLRGNLIGLFALSTGAAGWLCGQAAARIDPTRAAVRWVLAAGAAAVYGTMLIAVALVVSRGAVDVPGVVRHLVGATLYDGTLAALFYWPAARRGAAAGLIGDRRTPTWRHPRWRR